MHQAINMYTTRCSLFGKIEALEMAEGHGESAKPNITKAKTNEAERLLKNLPNDACIIALDEHGKELDSVGFSLLIENKGANGQPLVFLIGGSWGLDDSVLKKAHATLSLGKITLPHSLARIVLLEQIYRAQMIIAGREYHK